MADGSRRRAFNEPVKRSGSTEGPASLAVVHAFPPSVQLQGNHPHRFPQQHQLRSTLKYLTNFSSKALLRLRNSLLVRHTNKKRCVFLDAPELTAAPRCTSPPGLCTWCLPSYLHRVVFRERCHVKQKILPASSSPAGTSTVSRSRLASAFPDTSVLTYQIPYMVRSRSGK